MKNETEMTLFDHLTELRSRLIWVFAVFVLSLGVGLYFAGPVIGHLKEQPIAEGVPLTSLAPSDVLGVYMQFAFVIGMIVTLPVALFHVWRFVSPGLRPNERRVTLSFIPIAFFLFILGLSFGYYVVFPMVMGFMAQMNSYIGTNLMYGIAQYFSFMFNMVIPFGFLFELPIVVMFLTRLRILNPVRLAKARRFAYFGLAVIAIMLTPPDLISDVLVTIPLLVLYEISVWLSRIVYRKQIKEDEEWEKVYTQE